LLHLVGYLYYCQMGFNSVFKGLIYVRQRDKREKLACLVRVIITPPYHPMKMRAIASEVQ